METEEIKKIITEKAKWWIHYLGVGFWSVRLAFTDNTKEDRFGFITYAETSADWKYLRFVITFYPTAMANLDADELENIVVHELMHVFLNEMRESGIEHEERVASMLQRAFSWVETAIRQEAEEDKKEEKLPLEKEIPEKEVKISE